MSDLPQHWIKWLLPCLDWLETSKLDCPWPPIFGASGIAYMIPDWEHPLQHINNLVPYTLRMLTRWPGALDRSLASFFFSYLFLFLSFCVSAPLCASARLVVLKGFVMNPERKTGAEYLTFFCYLSSSLTSLPSPFPSHPGIGLHVNMEGGGHLDARWCRRVGSVLAKHISRESRGLLGTSAVAGSDQLPSPHLEMLVLSLWLLRVSCKALN